jgi:two-component system CheB/CheR fusion protein
VVAGASAGGLEAFSALLRHLPEDTGMAFVLVQHLDPTKESILDEILQKSTRLPVRRIEKGLKLSPNTVFVVPPQGRVDLRGVVFDVIPKMRGLHGGSPIDDFFRSTAEQFHSRVIGVVLSGTLSDGALGLAAIKAEGGVTFAQDAASAAFSEMPRAAVLTGAADLVLPPDRIAKEIARIARHPYVREEPAKDEPVEGEFKDASAARRLLHVLKSGSGVDFTNYRQSTFRRRVERRMALKRTPTLARYVDFIRSNPAEVQALFDDILITVTRFFRDPDVFEALRARVVPAILKDRARDAPIRVWVPGCATGEEVYSIAVLLLDALQESRSLAMVQIFATDISERALESARAGEYLEGAVRDVPPDLLRRFFVRTPAGYQISKAVRDLCVFARQNVAADPPFSGLDLLSCRNLLIYLDPTLQERVFPSFHYALKRGGFLLLGRSESLGKYEKHFQPFDRNNRIFVKSDGKAVLHAESGFKALVPRMKARPSEPAPLQPPLSKIDVSHLADRVVLSRYGPAGVLLNGTYEIVQFRGRTAPYLEPSSGSATLNVFKMTREGLLGPLRAAVLKARKTGERVRREGVKIRDDGKIRSVHIEVTPIRQGAGGHFFFLVLFEDARAAARWQAPPAHPAVRGSKAVATIRTLEMELDTTKEYLQAIIEEQEASNEELKSANEEILSANEELQSTNEELETAKEELQSTNEELTTVNEELQNRNSELAYAHNDLVNIFGINLPIVMISASGAIRRVTPPAERIFGLGPRDIGRKLSEFSPRLRNVDLPDLIEQVTDTLGTIDREVQDAAGSWYSLRIRPYRTVDNRIDGTIVALFDLRSTEQITRSRDYADAVLETVREALVILDEELRVRTANKDFYARVRMSPSQVEGKSISELWRLPERAPELQYFLERALRERDPIVNYELEIDLGAPGPRTLLVNARRLQPAGEPKPYVLMAFDDITERKWVEQGLRASELRYRLLFETAREGIWLLDGESRNVLDANPFLLELLGRGKEELVGREPWDLYADPRAARARFEDLRKHGFSFDPEITMVSKSGAKLRIEAVSNVYTVGRSRVVQCNMRNLTDRGRLEKKDA